MLCYETVAMTYSGQGGIDMKTGMLKAFAVLILIIHSLTTMAYAAVSVNKLSIILSNDLWENSITGTITAAESGLPLQSGTVTLDNRSAPITEGRFTLSDVPVGTQALKITGPYRQPTTVTVVVEPGTNRLDFSVKSSLNEEEIDALARITRAEAEGETAVGKAAVAATVLNRVESDRYPSTITGVIYQRVNGRYQYSPVADGRIKLAPRAQDYQAAFQALAGFDPTNGATGFFNPAKTTDRWVRSHPVTAVIGGHTFFRY